MSQTKWSTCPVLPPGLWVLLTTEDVIFTHQCVFVSFSVCPGSCVCPGSAAVRLCHSGSCSQAILTPQAPLVSLCVHVKPSLAAPACLSPYKKQIVPNVLQWEPLCPKHRVPPAPLCGFLLNRCGRETAPREPNIWMG